MAEVIELLSSSSPPAPPKQGRETSLTELTLPLFETFDFGSDESHDTGSIDFKVTRPYKRQRTSPRSSSNARWMDRGLGKNSHLDLTLDHSSDDGARSDPGPVDAVLPSANVVERGTGGNICDEITFSSSAPELRHTESRKPEASRRFSLDDSEDEPLDDVILSHFQPTRSSRALNDDDYGDLYSNRTANLLAHLTQGLTREKRTKPGPSKPKVSDRAPKRPSIVTVPDDIEFSSSPVKPRTSKTGISQTKQKTSGAADRAATKTDREAAKEVEKERKRLDREKKAQEKQRAADLAEVNKSKTSKKDATPEMILDMSSFLRDTSVGNQVEQYMKNVHVEVNYFDEEVNLTDNVPGEELLGNVVMWRRKVKSAYNDEQGMWEPTSRSRIVKEKHVLIHLPAVEFAAMVAGPKPTSAVPRTPTESEMKTNLDAQVASVRQRYQDCVPIYLIEGLDAWIKKNANAKNRAYTAAVRAQMVEADPVSSSNARSVGAQTRPRKRKKARTDDQELSFITPDVVEDLLLHLQLAHQPILIHHTVSPATTASQISVFTQQLSTRPYRLAQLDYNLKSASFCMDTGQVRTGDDAKDTFVKMLQEVQRVTPSMAYGIVDQWTSVRKLVNGFEKHGNLMLENVRKSVNRDGAWSDRKLGPMVSRRLYKVFMGRDPSATDGMS